MNATEFIKYAATFAAGAFTQHKYTQHQVFRDPGFLAVLDNALTDATEADLERIVRLDPDRLRDWAMAPPRLRGPLLNKWAQEDQEHVPVLEKAVLAFIGAESREEAEAIVSQKEEALRRRKSTGFWRSTWTDRRGLAISWIVLLIFIVASFTYVFAYH